jgi:hypothetical protein
MRPVKSINQMSRKISKAERKVREEAEETVVTNATQPKPNQVVKNNPEMKRLFNHMKKYNDHFTEADSIALNTLVFNVYMKVRHEVALDAMDMLDDNYERFLLRIDKFSKLGNEAMKQLCIPLNARLSLANDMAKVMIEEKKLAQFEEDQKQEVNPLLAVLEATKRMG